MSTVNYVWCHLKHSEIWSFLSHQINVDWTIDWQSVPKIK